MIELRRVVLVGPGHSVRRNLQLETRTGLGQTSFDSDLSPRLDLLRGHQSYILFIDSKL